MRDLPTFRDAYRKRRCIVPVDGFFEWKAIKGQRAKQPYGIAMKDGAPFGLAGIWANWKEPASGEWLRTFAIITTDANELVTDIHDRMPVILGPFCHGAYYCRIRSRNVTPGLFQQQQTGRHSSSKFTAAVDYSTAAAGPFKH